MTLATRFAPLIVVSAGPALVIIPLLLVGSLAAAVLALRPHRGPLPA